MEKEGKKAEGFARLEDAPACSICKQEMTGRISILRSRSFTAQPEWLCSYRCEAVFERTVAAAIRRN